MEIIEYSSNHCPACEGMASELKKLKKEGFKVNIINCDKNTSKCKDIQSVPTLIIKKGGRSKRMVGFMTAEDIKEKLKKL